MPTFVLFPALIVAAHLPASPSGDLQRRLRTGSESPVERVRLLRGRT